MGDLSGIFTKETSQTFYVDGKPIELFINFDQPKNDPFNGLNVTMPPTNSQEYLNTIDQILSSLKFYY